MTLAQIKAALKRGRRVYWANKNYAVYRDANGRFLIVCVSNGSCVGLTNAGGFLVDAERKFFTDKKQRRIK